MTTFILTFKVEADNQTVIDHQVEMTGDDAQYRYNIKTLAEEIVHRLEHIKMLTNTAYIRDLPCFKIEANRPIKASI